MALPDISNLTPDQRAALLAELNATPVGAIAADPAPADPAPAAEVQAPATPATTVTLDDLNNDPSLLNTLTTDQAFALYNEAESTAATLAGSLFQQLYAKAQ